MENLIGKIIDNYRIISILGKGGMGIVYKAYDTKLDRYVAIKMLTSRVADKERFVERFKREAKNQAKLSHPNIVMVYGFIEFDDFLGIVMEYVEGESLEKVIDRQGRFHLFDVIFILKQVLIGIGYAHSKGYVHRDIKPSNIILNKEGLIKVMDFGISKSLFDKDFTKTGSKIGTVYYMSPEQVKGEDVTNRSDIYSIGCTAFEMLTGEPPFPFESEYEVMEGHIKKSPPKVSARLSGIPEMLDKIVQKAMAKSAMERYSTCEEFLEEVNELDKFVAKMSSSYFQKKSPPTTKTKIMSSSIFAGIIIGLIALSYFVYNQVHDLIESNELQKFRKYSIQSLFESDKSKFNFSQLSSVQTGVKENLNAVAFADGQFAIATGDSGVVLFSDDSGKSWYPKTTPNKAILYDGVIFPNGKTIVIGDSSTILYSNDFMSNVEKIIPEEGNTFFKIKFISKDVGFITGDKGLLMKTLNGGINWERKITSTNELLFDIDFFDDKNGFAVGWNGTILKTQDYGETWQRVNSFVTDNYLKSITASKDGYAVIVGGDGLILRSTDYGNNWIQVKTEAVGALQKVKFLDDGYCIILGSKGTIMVSDDYGETWKFMDSSTYSNLSDLTVSPGGQMLISGVGGIILRIQ